MELLITSGDVDSGTYTTTKYTEEMIEIAIKERDELRSDIARVKESKEYFSSRLENLRKTVFEFFNAEYEVGDSSITLEVEDINHLLTNIGADTLKSYFTVTGTITFTLENIEAASKEEAETQVQDNIDVEWNFEGDIEWNLESTEVEEA